MAERALGESVVLGLVSIEGHAANTLGAALCDNPARMAESVACPASSSGHRRSGWETRLRPGRAATNLGVALELKGEREAAVLL